VLSPVASARWQSRKLLLNDLKLGFEGGEIGARA
jgi:hypothetical protein